MYLFIESDKKLNLIRVAAPYQSVFQDQLKLELPSLSHVMPAVAKPQSTRN